ncbi:hypothetical protein TNCT_315161, partial [Trichonephila clavata]
QIHIRTLITWQTTITALINSTHSKALSETLDPNSCPFCRNGNFLEPLLTLFSVHGECLTSVVQDTGDASAVSFNESGEGKPLKAYRTQLKGNVSIAPFVRARHKWHVAE